MKKPHGAYNGPSQDQLQPTTSQDAEPPKAKWNDVWAAILFWVVFAGFAGVALSSISAFQAAIDRGNTGNTNPDDIWSPQPSGAVFAKAFGAIVAWGLGWTVFYMFLVMTFTKAVIHVTFILNAVIYFALALLTFSASGNPIGGIIFALLGGLMLLLYFWWRHRIPLAAVFLEAVVDVLKSYPATLFTAFMGMILEIAVAFLLVLGAIGVQERFDGNGLLYLFVVFSFYWSTETVKNVVHTTVAGVFGTFYYLAGTAHMVNHPTLSSFKRAMTYSFGSVAYGSLIVALIETVRFLLRSASEEGSFVACCVECILSYIES